MNKRDRSQPGMVRCIRTARLKRLLHAVQKNSQHAIEQISITAKKITKPFGKRQYPLTHRDLWKNCIDEVCGRLYHVPCVAGGTDAAPYTRQICREQIWTAQRPEG